MRRSAFGLWKGTKNKNTKGKMAWAMTLDATCWVAKNHSNKSISDSSTSLIFFRKRFNEEARINCAAALIGFEWLWRKKRSEGFQLPNSIININSESRDVEIYVAAARKTVKKMLPASSYLSGFVWVLPFPLVFLVAAFSLRNLHINYWDITVGKCTFHFGTTKAQVNVLFLLARAS